MSERRKGESSRLLVLHYEMTETHMLCVTQSDVFVYIVWYIVSVFMCSGDIFCQGFIGTSHLNSTSVIGRCTWCHISWVWDYVTFSWTKQRLQQHICQCQSPLTLSCSWVRITYLYNCCCRCPMLAAPSSPVDNIWLIIIVWTIRQRIVRAVLCCIVYYSSHSDMLTVRLGLSLL